MTECDISMIVIGYMLPTTGCSAPVYQWLHPVYECQLPHHHQHCISTSVCFILPWFLQWKQQPKAHSSISDYWGSHSWYLPMGKTLFINVPHMHALILKKGWLLKALEESPWYIYSVFGGPISLALDWSLFDSNNTCIHLKVHITLFSVSDRCCFVTSLAEHISQHYSELYWPRNNCLWQLSMGKIILLS